MSIWRRRKLAPPHVPRSIDHSTFKERCNFIKFDLHLEVLSWPFNKMGKRYYCDYCDKTFADNSQNRKKHLNGVVHDRLRKLHYSLFRGRYFVCMWSSSGPGVERRGVVRRLVSVCTITHVHARRIQLSTSVSSLV